jgi:enoyl-CoA hydratase/carnithine racemase
MADTALVLQADEGAVRTLTLNRPERLNAFDQAMCAALTDALRAAEDDDSVRVIVLTGSGRAFSAGTDLVELAGSGDFRGDSTDPARFEQLIDALVQLPKPLVCAVNGLGVGIGATLLGHADLVVMAETARLRCPFTSLALVPEAASSVTFPFLLGRQAAAWILLSSAWIDAAEAKSMGLALKVVPDDELLAEVHELARQLAAQPLESLVASKRLLSATFAAAISAARDRESAAFDVQLSSPEHRAAVDSFMSDRRQRGQRAKSSRPNET